MRFTASDNAFAILLTLENDQLLSNITMHVSRKPSSFAMYFRIKEFPSFAASNLHFYSESVFLFDTEWTLLFEFSRYNPRTGENERVDSPRSRAQFFDLFVIGKRKERKDFSLNVQIDFAFKHSPQELYVSIGLPDTYRFDFDSENDYRRDQGIGVAKIRVFFASLTRLTLNQLSNLNKCQKLSCLGAFLFLLLGFVGQAQRILIR